MRYSARTALLVIAISAGACSENLEPKTPDGALHVFRDALESRNYELMVKLCSKATRDALHASVELIGKQVDGFKSYPPEYRIGALGIYPRRVLEAKTPASLLAAFLHVRLNQYPPSAGTRFGLSTATNPVVANGGASIMTHSGENITLIREGEDWRTTAFEQTVLQNYERIKANERILTENLVTLKKYPKPKPSAPPVAP